MRASSPEPCGRDRRLDLSALSSSVLAELGVRQPLYAVLDGARDPRIRGWLHDTRAPCWCLYRGALPRSVEDAAPWLLRLVPGYSYVEELFARGWNRSWGILLASDAPSRELRRHLRRFLRVRAEDGRILLFRYYDPRVLRLYLPTCTPAEIGAFFGPVSSMIAEASFPFAAHVFRPGMKGLDARLLQLPRSSPIGTPGPELRP